jgi:hypothetical protein
VVDATQPEDPNAEDSEGNFYFPATDRERKISPRRPKISSATRELYFFDDYNDELSAAFID